MKLSQNLSLLLLVVLISQVVSEGVLTCESKDVTTKSESVCIGLSAADSENEECCYMEGTSEGEGEVNEGECVELTKDDVQTNDALESIVGKIVRGTYWEGDEEKYVEIKKITCANSHFGRSSCEMTANPKGLDSCKNKRSASLAEECCYLDDGEGNADSKECVDIMKDDIGKLNEVKKKIKAGKYWSDYTEEYDDIKEFVCPSSSNCLKLSSFGLLLFAVIALL